jgi:hypothetical protein
MKKLINKIKNNLSPITWKYTNDKGEEGRAWFLQFWSCPIWLNKKTIVTILITVAITIFLCFAFYLNYLKLLPCEYCGKYIKGNISFCSKKCYEASLM